MGRTSRSHSSRLRIAALTADNLAALEPRRRSDPRGEVWGSCWSVKVHPDVRAEGGRRHM
jgi:hypothetical protein